MGLYVSTSEKYEKQIYKHEISCVLSHLIKVMSSISYYTIIRKKNYTNGNRNKRTSNIK